MKVKLDRVVLTDEVYTIELSSEETKDFLDKIDPGRIYLQENRKFTTSFIPKDKEEDILDYISKYTPLSVDDIVLSRVIYNDFYGQYDPVVTLEVIVEDTEAETLEPNWYGFQPSGEDIEVKVD
jgi:hypothetical protein